MRRNIFIILAIAIPLSILGYFKLFVAQQFVTTSDTIKKNFFLKETKEVYVVCVGAKNSTKVIKSLLKTQQRNSFTYEGCPVDYTKAFVVDTELNIKNPQTVFFKKNEKDSGISTIFNIEGYLFKISKSIERKIYPGKKEQEAKMTVSLVLDSGEQRLKEAQITSTGELAQDIDLIWCGDLDGDKKTDLLLKVSDQNKQESLYLYTSSEVKEPDFVKEIRHSQN